MAEVVLKQIIRDALLASGDVTGLVADRVYPGPAPEGAGRPHVILTTTGGERLTTQQGADAAWRPFVVEVASVGETDRQAWTLADAAEAVLYGIDGLACVELQTEYDAPNVDSSKGIHAAVRVFEGVYIRGS